MKLSFCKKSPSSLHRSSLDDRCEFCGESSKIEIENRTGKPITVALEAIIIELGSELE